MDEAPRQSFANPRRKSKKVRYRPVDLDEEGGMFCFALAKHERVSEFELAPPNEFPLRTHDLRHLPFLAWSCHACLSTAQQSTRTHHHHTSSVSCCGLLLNDCGYSSFQFLRKPKRVCREQDHRQKLWMRSSIARGLHVAERGIERGLRVAFRHDACKHTLLAVQRRFC